LPPAKGNLHYTLYSRTGKEKVGKTSPFNLFSADMALFRLKSGRPASYWPRRAGRAIPDVKIINSKIHFLSSGEVEQMTAAEQWSLVNPLPHARMFHCSIFCSAKNSLKGI
jgi:hypothetical protein